MKTPPWEAGLISVLRWFAVLQLILFGAGLLARSFLVPGAQDALMRLLWVGFATALILFIYLALPRLPMQAGRWYLPVALGVATIGPILAHFYMLMAQDWETAPIPLTGAWWLIPLLFVPLVVIAVQYDFRAVLIYCLATAALNIGLTFAAVGQFSSLMVPTLAIIVVRTLTFLVAGYVIVWLTNIQRQQRLALAEANRRLAQYTATLDQLATNRERNRIARELHDVLAHSLSSLAIQLEAVKTLWDPNPQKARLMLEQALATTDAGLTETRRALQELRAAPLEDLGLVLAIADCAQSTARRTGLALELELPEKIDPLPAVVEQNVYRIAQESIENSARHAHAITLSVALLQTDTGLTLTVCDDGQGFNPDAPSERGGFGIQGMQERAAMLGGVLSVTSCIGQGTTVQFVYAERM